MGSEEIFPKKGHIEGYLCVYALIEDWIVLERNSD